MYDVEEERRESDRPSFSRADEKSANKVRHSHSLRVANSEKEKGGGNELG